MLDWDTYTWPASKRTNTSAFLLILIGVITFETNSSFDFRVPDSGQAVDYHRKSGIGLPGKAPSIRCVGIPHRFQSLEFVSYSPRHIN